MQITDNKSHSSLMRRASLVVIALLLPVSLGACSWIAQNLANGLAKDLSGTIPIPDGNEFANCMTEIPERNDTAKPAAFGSTIGKLSLPLELQNILERQTIMPAAVAPGISSDVIENAGIAASVLQSPVFGALTKLYDRSITTTVMPAGADASSSQSSDQIKFSQKEFYEFSERIGRAATTNSWQDLAKVSQAFIVSPSATNDQSKANAAKVATFATLVAEYMKAYFRAGQFAQVTVNGTKFREAIKHSLQLTEDKEVDQIVNAFFPGLFKFDTRTKTLVNENIPLFGTIGTVGFVSRGGQAFQFPSLQATIDMSLARPLKLPKLDYTAVASDLIRVAAEAGGDTIFGVPAVSNATGAEFGLIKYEKGKIKDADGVTEERFSTIESISRGVEAGTTTIVGKLIRGAGPIALNNESIASAVETLVGVTAKKISEKVTWCYFSATKDNDLRPAAVKQQEVTRKFKTLTFLIPKAGPYLE